MAKILVVEDDPNIIRLVSKILEKLGHNVIPTHDGEQAWDILNKEENQDVTLVVTDVMMPKISGTELLKLMRGSDNHKEKPTILISGVVGLDKLEEFLESGYTYFLPKPISLSDLQELVKEILQ